MPANLENSAGATELGKGQFSFQSQRNAMPKNVQTAAQLHSSHRLAKFSKPSFSNTWNVNFQMFKLDLERQRNQRSNCQHPLGHGKSKRVPEKHLFYLLTMPNPWLCESQQTVENSQRDGNTRPPYLPPEKSVCRSRTTVRTGHGQQTGSKLGKEYVKSVYCHPV